MLIRKAVFTSGALALIAAGAYALVQAAKPVNATCPVKTGEIAKAEITTTYKGKTIGFC